MVLAIVVGVMVAWFAVALGVALVIGRAAALGERRHRRMLDSRRPVPEPVRLPVRQPRLLV